MKKITKKPSNREMWKTIWAPIASAAARKDVAEMCKILEAMQRTFSDDPHLDCADCKHTGMKCPTTMLCIHSIAWQQNMKDILSSVVLFMQGVVDTLHAGFTINVKRSGGGGYQISFAHPDHNLRKPSTSIRLWDYSQADHPILISGETGTGKSLFAKAIHLLSKRRQGRLISINCAAIPESLLESELFGHEKGAFTGAVNEKKGVLELAHGGTLFLDEIGEATSSTQVKILKAIEEKQFMRVGGSKHINVDVRIIAATNRNLQRSVQAKEFRKDLYYRLNTFVLRLPPLRERMKAVPAIVDAFFACRIYTSHSKRKKGLALSEAAGKSLLAYSYPGNYRELENIFNYAVAVDYDNLIDNDDLPEYVLYDNAATDLSLQKDIDVTNLTEMSYDEVEIKDKSLYIQRSLLKKKIVSLLESTNGNITLAAKQAEIKKSTFYSKMKYFGIDFKKFKPKAFK